MMVCISYFFNFLLAPQRPTRPDPRRSMVKGSGTGVEAGFISQKPVRAATSPPPERLKVKVVVKRPEKGPAGPGAGPKVKGP